jgi:hypothetical protein
MKFPLRKGNGIIYLTNAVICIKDKLPKNGIPKGMIPRKFLFLRIKGLEYHPSPG